MDYLSLYLKFIKIRLKGMVEYRGAFVWGAVAQAVAYLAEFMLIWIMINKFNVIGSWQSYEVLLLYAMNLVSYAIAGFFLYNPYASLAGLIKTGEFDELLIRPLNPLLYIITKMFNYGYFSHLVIGSVLIATCFVKLGVMMTPLKVVFLIIIIISGALIQGAAFLFVSVPAFWMTESNSLGFLLGQLRDFIRYPISIYPKGVQVMLTLVIPYAFISFYPAQYFLGKDDFSIFHPVMQYLSPLVGVGVFILAYMFWRLGIKSYSSSGS